VELVDEGICMHAGLRGADWNPDDTAAWEAGNKKIARRNLLCTVAADHVAFSIWTLWPVMALFMPVSVYGFPAGDKLLLGAVATLVGGCARIPYTLGIAAYGGRNWTAFSAFVLLIPTLATIVLLANPGLPLWPYAVCAALTGLGGGNYAASLANVNAFYPERLKGAALAINAGVGNLGVAVIQLVALLVLATAGHQAPFWVCAVYLMLLAVVGIAAALFMDNLGHGTEVNTMHSILAERDTYVISLLYICTFGSWIGFSFASAR
jgi:MFS transporter, NNP family, nitrate/nitrite transporter